MVFKQEIPLNYIIIFLTFYTIFLFVVGYHINQTIIAQNIIEQRILLEDIKRLNQLISDFKNTPNSIAVVESVQNSTVHSTISQEDFILISV